MMDLRGFKKQLWMVLLGLLLLTSCREAFEIEYEVADTAPILVVEGYMNAGDTESHYTLTYARPLEGGGGGMVAVQNATITIESEAGAKYYSQRTADGSFVISHPVLDPGQKYRLQIQTGDVQYESDFVEVKISPEISGLDWAQNEDGIEIYVSTDDPAGNTRYYRWEYEETWRYSPPYISSIILDGETVRDRTYEELIHVCYLSQHSSSILLATSADLTRDAIHRFPVTLIPNLSEKLSSRYSVLVKQIPLTETSYAYWEQLRESSENLGDIFGPMPAELRSNIFCVTDPGWHVIGMAEAASVTEKRMYIGRNETVEFWPVEDPYYRSCMLNIEPRAEVLAIVMNDPNFLLVEAIIGADPNAPNPSEYSYASRRCVDCRIKGGHIIPPDFWQER